MSARDIFHDAVKTALIKDLAVPHGIYTTFFQLALPKLQIAEFGLKLVVYDPSEEAIQQWKH